MKGFTLHNYMGGVPRNANVNYTQW